MIKRILRLLPAALLSVYLVFSVAFINPKADADGVCTGVEIEIAGSSDEVYLQRTQIEALLEKAEIRFTDRPLSSIHADAIEQVLESYKLIKRAEVYKTIDGAVKIYVYQRRPVLRVLSDEGNYYVDEEGQIMPIPNHYAAYVPLATGAISREYAQGPLYEFATFLRKHKAWNRQIVQIHLLPNQDVELTPAKGNHTILLGKIEHYKENLDKLSVFYEKGLSKVGWNKYTKINLKYENQVVCTKRKK
jgi:cell division protein FtsQ